MSVRDSILDMFSPEVASEDNNSGSATSSAIKLPSLRERRSIPR